MTGRYPSPPPGMPVRWRSSLLLPCVPADKRKREEREKEKKRKKDKNRNGNERLATPASLPHFGANFPTSVAARKSITALSHISMENSSDTCACRHRPAFQAVAFPTSFQRSRCGYFHWQQCRRRCSRVWATVPLHHQHLSSSWCTNHFR
jgi:hypothetical protein